MVVLPGSAGEGWSGGFCLVGRAGVGFGGAAEGDFEAGAFEPGDVVVDLAVQAGLALVVVRAEVLVAHSRAG
jgi:hypothetical protein